MVIIRNEVGQCVGSVTCKVRTLHLRTFAETVARVASINVAARNRNTIAHVR